MSLTAQQMFALLPAVYRTRDAANGGPLAALFEILAAQSGIVEQNIQQLYDDQFIETCSPWVVPYIGDLVGYNSVYEVTAATDTRAEVANTIGYRRRKGTLVALEQVTSDVSARATLAVEEFKRVITTESMRHVRPAHATTLNLRRGDELDRLGTPFDSSNRTIDVRRIAPRVRPVADPDPAPLDIALHGPGKANVPDVAIYVWRWKSFQIANAPAWQVDERRYRFSSLGNDAPLFSNPPVRPAFSSLTTRLDVPQAIRRREFGRRVQDFYGASLLLYVDGVAVDVSQVCCANLSDRPGGTWCVVQSGRIAIDPELGRIQFASDLPVPRSVRVTYCYGFPAAIGGGPYDRSQCQPATSLTKPAFLAVVGSPAYPTLSSAVAAWNGVTPGSSGIIVLPNFERYDVELTGASAISIPAQSNLTLVSAEPAADGNAANAVWNNACVTLTGAIEIQGAVATPGPDGVAPPPGQIILNGLRIAGKLSVTGGAVGVQVADTTLVPGHTLSHDGEPSLRGEPSIVVSAEQATLCVTRTITGPIAAASAATVRVRSSVLDATSPWCVAYAGLDLAAVGGDLHVEDSTFVGKVRTRTMKLASNTVFFARLARKDPWPAAVWCSRRQVGCVRFCYLPFDSITPRRYECLPRNAVTQPDFEPKFVTLRYGSPSYALLSGDVPVAIWQGADNGSQMGAYYTAQETEAIRNVQIRAPEYLPVSLEAGVFLQPSRPEKRQNPEPFVYGLNASPGLGHGEDEPEFFGIGTALL